MDTREMLEKLGVVEGNLWMVGIIKGVEVEKGIKGRLSLTRYFSYKDGAFYVCRSAGPGVLAVESKFDRDEVDYFRAKSGFILTDPSIKIMIGDNIFNFAITNNKKALKKIVKLMNKKANLKF